MYAYWATEVLNELPAGVVTVMSTVEPAVPDGTTTVIVVSLVTVNAADFVPNATPVVPLKY